MKAFYFRFSSRDTALDKLGFDRCWQSALDWGCEEEHIYWDFDSGGNPERENYQKLISAIKEGKYTELGTPNQIRLNRDISESDQFGKLLRKHKIKLVLLESWGQINLETSEGRRQYSLDSLFAAWERDKSTERNIRNWEDIRRKRISIITPFGYVIGSDRKPEIDVTPTVCLLDTKQIVSYADILREIIDLAFEVGSLTQVTKIIHAKYGVSRFNQENLLGAKPGRKRHIRKKKLNPNSNNPHIHRKPLFFSPSGLSHLLRNPILIGHLVYLKGEKTEITVIDNHPAFLSQEEFDRLDKVIGGKANPFNAKGTKAKYPLTGLIYCGLCGGNCYSAKCGGQRERDYYYFKCKNIPNGCKNKPIRAEAIEKVLITRLIERYQEITNKAIAPPQEQINPKIFTLEKQLASLRSLPIIDDAVQELIKKTQLEIDRENNNEDNNLEIPDSQIAILKTIFQDPLYWETLPQAQKREIYHSLVNRIVLNISDGKSFVDRIDLRL